MLSWITNLDHFFKTLINAKTSVSLLKRWQIALYSPFNSFRQSYRLWLHAEQATQHLHAWKLRAIWRIYTQNAREKQACKIRQSLNYTQYACIYHREISSPLLLHTSCIFFKGRFKRSRKMLSDHSLFPFKFQYEMYILIYLFESGLFKVDTRFYSSQHVHVLYISSWHRS